ncbi:MAG: hypothetical protein GXP00_03420 [Alphaproteobacteria bacterium]|nr:hypothetical protein [Alphaproteobacteria bacterium]
MIKRAVIFSIIFGSIILVSNQAQADQVNSFLNCTKISENESRLACFDSAAKEMQNPVMSKVKQREVKITKEQKVANFGKNQLRVSPVKKVREERKKEENKALKEIRLKVERYVYTASKKFVLFMKNGQVWKQKDGGRIRLPKGEFEVKIKKGLISGYNMIVPNKRTIIRVKRLK